MHCRRQLSNIVSSRSQCPVLSQAGNLGDGGKAIQYRKTWSPFTGVRDKLVFETGYWTGLVILCMCGTPTKHYHGHVWNPYKTLSWTHVEPLQNIIMDTGLRHRVALHHSTWHKIYSAQKIQNTELTGWSGAIIYTGMPLVKSHSAKFQSSHAPCLPQSWNRSMAANPQRPLIETLWSTGSP